MSTSLRLYDAWTSVRSFLFVPGDSQKKMEKALTCPADVLIFDLEDSVADSRKTEGRKLTADFLASLPKTNALPRLMVRINGLHTPWGDEDLHAIMPHAPQAILLPKTEGRTDLVQINAKLDAHEALNKLEKGSTALLALTTETAKGVLSMSTYSELPTSVERRLIGLTWGYEDLSLALNVPEVCDHEGHACFEPYRLARTLLLLAASAAKVLPVDGISRNFKDFEVFEKACTQAYHLGFWAKMAIHPAQVPIINQAFSPSPELLSHAQEVVSAFESQPECGVIAINGTMFDRPHYEKAKSILARATVQYAPC